MPEQKKKATTSVSNPQLLYVEWLDAAVDAGWSDELDHRAHVCFSTGWLIKETKIEIVLAADISSDTMPRGKYDTNRRIAIPKAWIRLRKVLNVNGRKARSKRDPS